MSKVKCAGCGRLLSEYRARLHSKDQGSQLCQIASARRKIEQEIEMETYCEDSSTQSSSTSMQPGEHDDDMFPMEQDVPDDNHSQASEHEDWIEHPNILHVDSSSDEHDDDTTDGYAHTDDPWDEACDEDDGLLGAKEVAQIIQEWSDQVFEMETQLDVQNMLTEDDRDNLKMFALRLSFNLPRSFHDKFRFAYADKIHVHSLYIMHRRMAILSGLVPELFDCCPNSCCAFTDTLRDKTGCPYCQAPRYQSDGKTPTASFEYLPIIPRLQARFENPEAIQRYRYRTERQSDPHIIADIFDGSLYQDLCGQHVIVDDVIYQHCYFQDWRDGATGLMGDGAQIFKRARRGCSSAWPFILIDYSLDPVIRTRIENVIPVFIIPGPRTPKNFNSFLWPFSRDCKLLAIGVRTFDVSAAEFFMMRAYNIVNSGDMIAIRYTQGMKGPNALSPCRVCRIQGFRQMHSSNKTYYVPLIPPIGTDEYRDGLAWDPMDLPMRSDADITQQIADIRAGRTQQEREKRAMMYGINGETILRQVPGMSHTQSYPYDGMHLLFENHVKNMINLWKGKFAKGLDEGTEQYIINEQPWEQIGIETTAASATIPSAFVSALPDIHANGNLYTAEMYSFWIIYIAPHVLKARFRKRKYYDHMLEFVDILKTVLKFSITRDEVKELRLKIITYVQTYEKYYYQYREERLTTCRLTVHALLHICDDIERTGPVWVNWCFVMERYCGIMIPAVKSKRKPYANLNKRNIHLAQLTHIALRFDLADMLRFEPPHNELSSHEFAHDACPGIILRWPRQAQYRPPHAILSKIVAYFVTMYSRGAEVTKPLLPDTFERWGNVRISDGGDVIRGKASLPKEYRDNSFVKYILHVDKHASKRQRKPEFESKIFYGQLDFVVIVSLPACKALGVKEPKTHVLALVQTCKTQPPGGDASQDVVSYSDSHPPTMINVEAIRCAVGRIRIQSSKPRWGIIDRSGDYARTVFVEGGDDPTVG